MASPEVWLLMNVWTDRMCGCSRMQVLKRSDKPDSKRAGGKDAAGGKAGKGGKQAPAVLTSR